MNKRIKNINYRRFLDDGIITILNEEHIKKALANIKGRHVKEGRALLIALYYTGARPNEILNLKGDDFKKEGNYILVRVPASKGGLPRTIHLQYKHEMVKELWQYAASLFPEMFLFYHYKNEYIRESMSKTGKLKEYTETTNKLRYHVKKWFTGVIEDSITTYYLRHNRFSKLAESGATSDEMRQLKGSKTYGSITPYLHMSRETARKVAKKLD